MASYRYWTTHLVTGQVLADNIPLTVQSFGRQINGVGQLTGSLNLAKNTTAQNTVYLEALEPRRTLIWAAQDDFPVWCGIVWDWPHQSIADSTLPIAASTPESLFQHRQIDANLSFTGKDAFAIFAALQNFAISKTPNGAMAGLQQPVGTPAAASGVTLSLNYQAADLRKVYDAFGDLAATAGFEWTYQPALDASGNPIIVPLLGYPRLGTPITTSQLVFQYPGNAYDYAYPRTGSSSANALIATAPPNGAALPWQSQYPHGRDDVDLAAGYPLLEDTISYAGTGVTSQAQINAYADGKLPAHTGAQESPSVSLAPGARPLIREINLGDYAWLLATSPLHPAGPNGEPGLQTQARISGWTCTPPGANQTETIKIQLGGLAA
ncbi:hypothetical protein [Actinoallomurus sp. NPDC052274]|uniref:hypothetical protein n=1 Tax=Actinoallomurus sp. NPDC052274 TaxID=3155420 RepID=UPI00341E375C